MRFEWDPAKDVANRRKHGLGFEEASLLFRANDYLEIFDELHSEVEERIISIGPIDRGVVVRTEREHDVIRIISARFATRREFELFREYMED